MDMLSNAVVKRIKEYEASRELLKSIDVYDYAKVKELIDELMIKIFDARKKFSIFGR